MSSSAVAAAASSKGSTSLKQYGNKENNTDRVPGSPQSRPQQKDLMSRGYTSNKVAASARKTSGSMGFTKRSSEDSKVNLPPKLKTMIAQRKRRRASSVQMNEMEAYYEMINKYKLESRKKPSRLVIKPDSKFAKFATIIMIAAVLWSAFSVPISLTYNISIEPEGADLAFEIILELLFIADIVLSFHVGYTERESKLLVMDITKIKRHYMKR
jgi:hypothetical protein